MNLTDVERERYLEVVEECYENLRGSTIEGVTEIAEYEVEKRCSEAIVEHESAGEAECPQLNAAIVAGADSSERALSHTTPEIYESGAEYLATVAHTALKYDLIPRVLDEQAEAEREGEAA